jgi:hypothetical protein
MTLLDAPRFDEIRDRRIRVIVWSSVAAFTLAVIVFWIFAGTPVDWPWNWYAHLRGRATINRFFDDVQKNDMADAYAVWLNDPHWQQHQDPKGAYPFARFQDDWSPNSSQNEYGAIKSHEIAAGRINGNVLVMGVWINGSKSKPLFLAYDPKTHTLAFSPVELYLGP